MGVSSATHVSAILLLLAQSTATLDISFCSSDNTGSDLVKVSNDFQSNGACGETCRDEYAYAVIQGFDCWCSNYAPGDSTSTSDCADPCPGFPDEWCGSNDKEVFAYFELSLAPSGTAAAASRPTTDETSPSPSRKSEPDSETETESIFIMSKPRHTTTAAVPATSDAANLDDDESRDDPSEIIVTVTQQGTTITSVTRATPTEDGPIGDSMAETHGSNPGRIAGIAIGAIASVVAILAVVFWIFYRRRQRRRRLSSEIPPTYADQASPTFPRRHASQMSQAGLIDKNMRVLTTGLDAESGGTSAGTSSSHNNRHSAGTDMRLNPNALYAHEESQHSSVSLQDNRDYSRQLQVRNPDS